MAEVMIRTAVSPDYAIFSSFKHSIQAEVVWQMDRIIDEDQVSIGFREIRLPRPIRVDYPYSSEGFMERAKAMAVILVACIEGAPVGYLGLSTIHADTISWIKDLVVHERWRRRGFASVLIRAARDWSVERGIHRMTIEMSSKNYPGICLAKKHNFEFCGYNDFYYSNNDIAIFFTRFMR